MAILSRELEIVQNPVLGAVLLWRFVTGFDRGHPAHAPVPIPLLFVVLPMVLHEGITEVIASTREASGLRTFADKFIQSSRASADELVAVHERAREMRPLTMRSLRLATACRLIHFYAADAAVVPLSRTFPTTVAAATVRPLFLTAERLGVWCGRLTLHEVATILKVRF